MKSSFHQRFALSSQFISVTSTRSTKFGRPFDGTFDPSLLCAMGRRWPRCLCLWRCTAAVSWQLWSVSSRSVSRCLFDTYLSISADERLLRRAAHDPRRSPAGPACLLSPPGRLRSVCFSYPYLCPPVSFNSIISIPILPQ